MAENFPNPLISKAFEATASVNRQPFKITNNKFIQLPFLSIIGKNEVIIHYSMHIYTLISTQ